jgi:hypothetical protein
VTRNAGVRTCCFANRPLHGTMGFMTTRVPPRRVPQFLKRHGRLLVAIIAVLALVGVFLGWSVVMRGRTLNVCGQFKTSSYPVGIVGSDNRGYVLTSSGEAFVLDSWITQNEGVDVGDNPTAVALSSSGTHLLVAGEKLTLLDAQLKALWSRKTTAPSIVEEAVFTKEGKVAVVFSLLADQSRLFYLYDIAGKYLTSYTVPDFGRGSQVDLASTGTLVVTLSSGTLYTVSPEGKVLGKFTVPNPDQKLAGLASSISADGERIMAGYGFYALDEGELLPRYVFDLTGKQVAELSASTTSAGQRSLGSYFLLFGKDVQLLDSMGRSVLSVAKMNYTAVDASMFGTNLAVLFQENTASQTAVYFVGVYDIGSSKLVRQWSTAESETPRISQLPGLRTAVVLGSGFLILCP